LLPKGLGIFKGHPYFLRPPGKKFRNLIILGLTDFPKKELFHLECLLGGRLFLPGREKEEKEGPTERFLNLKVSPPFFFPPSYFFNLIL